MITDSTPIVEHLQLEAWEDTPTEALQALESDAVWVGWARELLPDMIDLSDKNVRYGSFAEMGTARGLIWDLRAAFFDGASEDFLRRAFAFAQRCAQSDEPELYNPALIGFYCKVAWSDEKLRANGEACDTKGRMTMTELATRMPLDMIENDEDLLSHHYGKTGYQQLVAAKTGRGTQ